MAEWERFESRRSVVRVYYVIRAGAGWDVVQPAGDQPLVEASDTEEGKDRA